MKPRILFVDDEPHLVKAFERALRKEDFHIVGATSGREALELLKNDWIDVVVSDEQMPGMTGSELLARIARDHPQVIRIMLTGHASLDIAVRAINEGQIYRFMVKPVSKPELALAIRQALEHRELLVKVVELQRTIREQSALLEDLESSYPGITQLHTDTDGRIILDSE